MSEIKESRNRLQPERLSVVLGQGNRIESNHPVENVAKESDAKRASTWTAVSAVEMKRAPRSYDKHFINNWLTPKYPQYSSWLMDNNENILFYMHPTKERHCPNRGTDNFCKSTLLTDLKSIEHGAIQELAFQKDLVLIHFEEWGDNQNKFHLLKRCCLQVLTNLLKLKFIAHVNM